MKFRISSILNGVDTAIYDGFDVFYCLNVLTIILLVRLDVDNLAVLISTVGFVSRSSPWRRKSVWLVVG
jgi:hypothetical protein